MKRKRTLALLILFILACGAAIVKHTTKPVHPDAEPLICAGENKYPQLVQNGEVQEGWYVCKLSNGLPINVQKTSSGYKPKWGIYRNNDNTIVHVKLVEGIVTAHTHADIPIYELGSTEVGDVKISVVQFPPDHYDRGPSKFVIKLSGKNPDLALKAGVTCGSKTICPETECVRINSRAFTAVFSAAYPEYPEGATLTVRKADQPVDERKLFSIHKLPPRETLSRYLVE